MSEGHPILAACLDFAMRPLARYRPGVVSQAEGRVLEIGVGTGLNLPLYGAVDHVDAIEPDPHMLRRAKARADALSVPVTLHSIGAERLPFADETFDTVVATFVLCTIPDPAGALAEAMRVLKPGGRILFAEHVRSTKAPVAAIQRTLEPAWVRLAGGCHLTRDAAGLLAAAGVADLDVRPRGSPWALNPVITGEGRKAWASSVRTTGKRSILFDPPRP